ncbi:MAG: DUF296 domain-containing protein [Candidatus Bipolaricaulota bacterium]
MLTARHGEEWVIRLLPGEDLVAALSAAVEVPAVLLGAIGMVRDARLGYWNGTEYEQTLVEEPAELAALQGNFAASEGGIVLHAHAVLATRSRVYAGHLLAARVAVTAEIALRPLTGIRLERGPDGLRPSVS